MANDTGVGKFPHVKPIERGFFGSPSGRNVVRHPPITLRKSMPSKSRSFRLLLGLFCCLEGAIMFNLFVGVPALVLLAIYRALFA